MRLPLSKRLKKQLHVRVASLQDELIELSYGIEQNLVLHGGTSIWRCYQGNRFSEDIDFYAPDAGKWERLFLTKAKSRNLQVLKFKRTDNLFFIKVSDGNVEVRLEVNFSNPVQGCVQVYERVDGSFLTVLSLSPEELVGEKIRAYRNRRLVRDLYDLVHLGAYVKDENAVRSLFPAFLKDIRAPKDEPNLKTIVYTGLVPTFQQMVSSLKARWL